VLNVMRIIQGQICLQKKVRSVLILVVMALEIAIGMN